MISLIKNKAARRVTLAVGAALFVLLGAISADHASAASMANDGNVATQNSLSFEGAVEEGLRSNLDLLAAKFEIPASKADELTAGLWSNPSFQLSTTLHPFGPNWDGTSSAGPRQYDAIVSLPLDLSGKRSASKEGAKLATEVAEANFQNAVRQKVLELRLAYIDALVFQSQLSLAHEKEDTFGRLVGTIEKRIGARGLLPLLQSRARLARDQAKLEVRQKELSLREAKNALAVLLGKSGETASEFELSTKLRDFQFIDLKEKEALIQEATKRRPDFLATKLAQGKADADHRLARAQVWDDFSLNFGVTYQAAFSPRLDDPTSTGLPGDYSWDLGFTMPLPVFNRNQGNIEKSLLKASQAEKQQEALRVSIRHEIVTLIDQLQVSRELVSEYESKQLATARLVRDSAQRQFGTGGSGFLEYFDAVSAYNSTVSTYYDAVAEYRRNLAKLSSAVGRDVTP